MDVSCYLLTSYTVDLGSSDGMVQVISLHPTHPQRRNIGHALSALVRSRNEDRGGLGIYPTDTGYVIGCPLSSRKALIRLVQMKPAYQPFLLLCRNLSQVSAYAYISNFQYALLRRHTLGPMTFILVATPVAKRIFRSVKPKTLGIRLPDHPSIQALLEALNEPLMVTELPDPIGSVNELCGLELKHCIDLVIDSGEIEHERGTVLDLTEDQVNVTFKGKGDL